MEAPQRAGQGMACASFLLFALACALSALDMRYVQTYVPGSLSLIQVRGIGLLLEGELALIVGVWAWLANVALIFGWVALLRRRWRRAMTSCGIALLAAADLLRIGHRSVSFALPLRCCDVWWIERPLIGCYLWIGSMAIIGGGALLGWYLDQRRRPDGGEHHGPAPQGYQ